ncbi:substrate-binding domain-containing protein (plasmid) [Rhodococcus opacus]|uniref:sugar ABC transporter substrate-binding protein n=1 Tax=Rhodococcus opacus TaxID=37919 RepID=UPI0034D30A45
MKLAYLTAGLSSASGTEGAKAVEEAAASVGWEVSVFDGKFSPDRYQEGMRRAISWGADAVLMNGIDCAGNEAPLQALRDAGIKVVAIAAVDCDEGGGTGEGLFEAPAYPGAATPHDYFEKLGAIQADWIIAQSSGQAKVIEFPVPDFLITRATQEGFERQLATCAGCEIVDTVAIGINDFGPGVQDKAEQALLQNPDADYISANYDELMSFGIAAAVMGSGRNDAIGVIAGNGYPYNMNLIRNNQGQDAGYAYDFEWDHYAGFDTVNRILQAQRPGEVGPPVVLFDKENNLPAEGSGYVSGADFRSVFAESWGK